MISPLGSQLINSVATSDMPTFLIPKLYSSRRLTLYNYNSEQCWYVPSECLWWQLSAADDDLHYCLSDLNVSDNRSASQEAVQNFSLHPERYATANTLVCYLAYDVIRANSNDLGVCFIKWQLTTLQVLWEMISVVVSCWSWKMQQITTVLRWI